MGKTWQTVQGLISLAQGAWKVLGLIGWQHLAIALFATVAAGLVARLQGVPISLAVIAAFPVFVASVYLLKLPAFITGTTEIAGQRLPNPQLWARLERYTLGQAACLIANVQPIVDPAFMPLAALPYYELMHQAVRNGSLEAHTPNLPFGQQDPLKSGQAVASVYHVVMRADLQAFWDKQGLPRPAFLRAV